MEMDFVMAWVDGNDPAWQKEKRKTEHVPEATAEADDRDERYRDWDNLQYWFRGVEQFAPWVTENSFCHLGASPQMAEYGASEASYCKARRFHPF